ncbi:HAD-IA family hydrolase [Salibaculum sp.]|uniref:HAD-IA family hydrolase n=1 Tax=Salibaculum sp. TaxID=2855480 RepID=UPI002B46622A|nr:HAD-IA family hydrolase [Salibaculum sp.]HKL68688.1 HAD-IA family hydrolase [Salibaculum sp.]
MRTVIFDLDGTLAETSGDMVAAANVCLRDFGPGALLDPVTDAATAMRGGRAMLALGLARAGMRDAAEVDRQYPLFLSHYAAALDVHSRLFPGALPAIEALRGAGYRVGVCTNKPEALADRLLTSLGVRDLFASLIGADTLPTRKPDAAPYLAAVDRAGGRSESSVLVGDTVTDRDTARAAGVPVILVTFGPHGDAVRGMGAQGLIGGYDALGAEVRRLIG